MAEQEKKPKRSGGQRTRTVRALAIISALGAGLIVYNSATLRRDVGLATQANPSEAQKAFLVAAADRPDVAVFFKNLTPEGRLAMSRAVGRYDDPKLPVLAAKLLGDFDADARKVLTESLITLGRTQPEAVAAALKEKGAFQTLGVTAALRRIGDPALPLVVKALSDGDARPNAVNYLVESGPAAIPALLPALDDANQDVRLAAADALGKIRAREAVPKLLDLYAKNTGDPQAGYLAALAGVGDPTTERLLAELLSDPAAPGPRRATAALGLGRIATPSSCRTLWSQVGDDDTVVRNAVFNALSAAGDAALGLPLGNPADRLRVAAAVDGALAEGVIREALASPALAFDAVRAAQGRAGLAPALAARLDGLDVDADGDLADALVTALASTAPGRTCLATLRNRPEIEALAARRAS